MGAWQKVGEGVGVVCETFLDQARWENERGCCTVVVVVVVDGGGGVDDGRCPLRMGEWLQRQDQSDRCSSVGVEEWSKSWMKCWKDGVR